MRPSSGCCGSHVASRHVRVTITAERRLRAVAQWTRDRWGPAQAVAYVGDLRAAFERIAEGTLRGRDARAAWGEGVRAGLLFAKVGSHIVLFRERPGEVEVVDVLHEAMDLPRRAKG